MAGDLDALRSECDELSKKRFRAAFVSLLILFVAVLAFTRAFRRIDRDEIRERMLEMAKLVGTARSYPELSYVFDRTWREVVRDENLNYRTPRTAAELEAQRAAARDLHRQAEELEKLAADWFSLDISAGGTDVGFDLRYWLPVIPLILWMSWAYLVLIGTKLHAARQLAAALVDANSGALDRLMFAESQAYARYPEVLGARLYGLLAAVLLVYFGVTGAPMWDLLTEEAETVLVPLYWTLLYLLVLPTWFVAALIWWMRWRLAHDVTAVTGTAAETFAEERLLDAARHFAARVRSFIGRIPRATATLGAAAVIITPFTMVATTCQRDEGRSGVDLLLGQNEAVWFTASAFGESYLPHLGRVFYGATILLALIVATTAAASLLWPTRFRGPARRAACAPSPRAPLYSCSSKRASSFPLHHGFTEAMPPESPSSSCRWRCGCATGGASAGARRSGRGSKSACCRRCSSRCSR